MAELALQSTIKHSTFNPLAIISNFDSNKFTVNPPNLVTHLEKMAIRGIMAAFSRNARPDIMSSEDLMAWYDNIHIPDVIGSSGINTALRFENLDTSSKWPWLVVYPANDINFTQSNEFVEIPKGGQPEIKGYEFMELGEVDLRICERVLVFETSYTKPGMLYLYYL
jgi:hypothetical protein